MFVSPSRPGHRVLKPGKSTNTAVSARRSASFLGSRLRSAAGRSYGGSGDHEDHMARTLCRIEVAASDRGSIADLRALPADSTTSIAEKAKETSGGGRVSLLVPDEEHQGERAHLVFVSPDGEILAQRDVDCREEPMSELDELDRLAAETFEGYLVRKDLAQQFRGSTQCQPMSASSCSADTALPPTPTRSPKDSPSSSAQ